MEIFLFFEFLVLIYLLSANASLRSRIDALEKREHGAPLPGTQAAPLPLTSELITSSPSTPSIAVSSSSVPDWSDQFTSWLKEDWLMKLGAMIFILGFGWFVTYAFMHDWIGPMGRILLGLIVGAGVLILGFWRITRYQNQGSVFLVLGSVIILITVYAARLNYGFFTPITATALMLFSVAFVAFAAVHFRMRMLAFAGLVLAGIVPLLVHSDPNYIGLFTYLAVVTVGTLWVILLTEWRDLLVGALALVTLYSIPHWVGLVHKDLDVLMLFAYGFSAIFFAANIVGFLRTRAITQANIVGAVWNGGFLLLWVLTGVADEWQSLVLSFWTVVFLAAAFLLFRFTGNAKPLLAYAAVGVAFLGAGTAVELDGAALGIAFTLEVTAVVLLSLVLVKHRDVVRMSTLLFFFPGFLVLQSIGNYPDMIQTPELFHEHFFLIALFVLVLGALGLSMRLMSTVDEKGVSDPDHDLSKLYLVTGSVFGYVLLWLFLHQALEEGTATMIALALYTVAGIAAYLSGREYASKGLRVYGGVLLGFVVGHLLLVDVWQMELFFRIITFFVIGALLMATAFVGRKRKESAV
jgi:uncharacterized membrane protein